MIFLVNDNVLVMWWIVVFVGIGWWSCFISVLNVVWFLVWLMVVREVFSSWIFNLLRMLVWFNVIVRFNLVCLLSVGSKVLGWVVCRILVILVKVRGFK